MLQKSKDSIRTLTGGAPPERTALVLAGGKSLGAFEAGAYGALHNAGVRPDWILGASIGAVNGAIIAGNPVERRIEALRDFWTKAGQPTPAWVAGLGPWGEFARRNLAQAQAMAFGSPAVFAPNPALWAGFAWHAPCSALGLYDLAPLRRSLEEFVDFALLNRGDVRFTAVATDLETGGEALFDTDKCSVGPEHILASAAMLTEFPPVEIDGRLFVDGGLHSNLPIDVVQRERQNDTLLFAVDLFSAHGRRFRNIAETTTRRQELLMVAQSHHMLEAQEREEALRRALRTVLSLLPADLRDHPDLEQAVGHAKYGDIRLVRLAWTSGDEVGVNTYDWSDLTLTQRWKAGERTANEALGALRRAGSLTVSG